MIEDAEMEEKGSLSGYSPFYQSMPQSPVGVLDAISGGYSTDSSLTSANANPNPKTSSFQESPVAKRRKYTMYP